MSRFGIHRCLCLLFSGLALLLGSGCDLPERPPLTVEQANGRLSEASLKSSDLANQDSLEAPGSPHQGRWDIWDAYFVGGRQVGYAHLQATPGEAGWSNDVRFELESRLYVNQGPARLLQRVWQISTETSAGHLLGFEGLVSVGPALTRYSGTVVDDQLRVEMVRGTKRTTRTVEWSPTYRGLVAMEQSLRQRPMTKKGEQRSLRMLLPGRYELATARMRCDGMASVPLLDGDLHSLWEINCEIRTDDGSPTFSTLWTTSEGEILRTHSPALQLIAYRTDKETATNFAANDQVLASIPVAGEINAPQQAARVGYKIFPTDAAARANFAIEIPPVPGQYVRRADENVLQVLVSRRSETTGKGFVASDLMPSEADTAANPYVDSDHGRIRRFASMAVGQGQIPQREVAIELARAVRQTTVDRGEFIGLSKASVVEENIVGDSTELSLFLTALLRAKGIPARLVVGLKFLPGTPNRLAYHCWTMAYVDGTWLHLDATEGGLAAADRLAFSTTDLRHEDPFEMVLPLLEGMRAMRVEVVGQN